MTNADFIRNMSDEDLARFLDEVQRQECEALHEMSPDGSLKFNSRQYGWLLWLQEDTGLTPERCAEFARADAEGRYIVMRDAEQEGVARLRELAEADKDGRVVVLPCRQGDELWTYCNHPVKRVYSFTVSDVSTLNGRTVLNTLGLGTIRPEDIGKTVFVSREEAERAMEGKKDG